MVERRTPLVEEVLQKVWDYAETALEEYQSSELLKSVFMKEGFSIREKVAGLDTAFVAEWGNEGPRIGFLSEYDALPMSSQRHASVKHEPVMGKTSGHACGHNCLGAGAMGAALALKDYLLAKGIKGTVVFYGCPAEESFGGKTVMVREGEFKDLDFCLTWHPGCYNKAITGTAPAMISASVEYHGIRSHAGAAPEMGRSALDAAELAHVGINYLREHVIPQVRISYGYENAGFPGAGIVQDYCKVNYSIKAPTAGQAESVLNRLEKIIQGANLMTETTSECVIKSKYADYVSNQVLTRILHTTMTEIPEIKLSDSEKAFVHGLFKDYKEDIKTSPESFFGNLGLDPHTVPSGTEFWSKTVPFVPGISMGGSTDVGDVSHVTPCAQMNCTISPIGTPAHSWQMCSCAGSSLGLKGTMFAAKVLCGTALSVILRPELISRIREEFNKNFKDERSTV